MRGPASLEDPPLTRWQQEFQEPIDAKLLIAAASEEEVEAKAERWADRLRDAGATLLVTEKGLAIKRKVNEQFEGVEHFGYVDGRSQPLSWLRTWSARRARSGIEPSRRRSSWSRTQARPRRTDFGSYFVFRKLEQNVQGFKEQEEELAKALSLEAGPFKDRPGALIVGRFEDGTPVVLNPLAQRHDAGKRLRLPQRRAGQPMPVPCPYPQDEPAR